MPGCELSNLPANLPAGCENCLDHPPSGRAAATKSHECISCARSCSRVMPSEKEWKKRPHGRIYLTNAFQAWFESWNYLNCYFEDALTSSPLADSTFSTR